MSCAWINVWCTCAKRLIFRSGNLPCRQDLIQNMLVDMSPVSLWYVLVILLVVISEFEEVET